MDLRPFAEEDSGGEKECEKCDFCEHDKKESRVGHAEEEDGRRYLYRPDGNHRSGAENGETDGDRAPAKPHMQSTVPNRYQQRLNEKEHKPGCNCDAVYSYERKDSGVDSSASHPGAVGVEGMETDEHQRKEYSGGGAVEIPISFHVGLQWGILGWFRNGITWK
jgi:hypothetical protein